MVGVIDKSPARSLCILVDENVTSLEECPETRWTSSEVLSPAPAFSGAVKGFRMSDDLGLGLRFLEGSFRCISGIQEH